LLRVVAVFEDGVSSLAVDTRHRLPGRGAYLHEDPACLAKAERRRAFTRALRVAGVLDTSALAAHLAETAGATGKTDGGHGHPTAR
jgi:predicted RNA-binding protein YlxR (DUF448 family)